MAGDVPNFNDTRIWKSLDTIADRLTGIENQLSDIVRLEEKVNGHENAIKRYGKRLDRHDERIRDAELWQANHGDKASIERLIVNLQDEVHEIADEVYSIKTNRIRIEGQKDITKSILKWAVGILTATLIYQLTGG